ncbi:hypothetical protein ITJ38_13025 [Agreia pratensis]|uniref:hypothetical protein n=1 Tax=Agreia pratensis TaxID=150121 RepID=UPI00188BB34B|nr:hypothetical protein [Agreia pratensis]MBF4635330.1 hypothetical protein [Agreia pratensis]
MVTINRLSSNDSDSRGVALVLPGVAYTAQAPLLYWPIRALEAAGWDVWGIDWHSDIDDSVRHDMRGFVESAVARAEELLPQSPKLVLAKSLGTLALPAFVDREIRAAWLTPILTDPTVARALADVSRGAHLGVGGSADPVWRPELIGGTNARLVTVEGAGHGLEVPSPAWRSAANSQLDLIAQVVAHLLAGSVDDAVVQDSGRS